MTGTVTRAQQRKPYAPPRLTVFGTLRLVTLSNITMNMNDPGNSSMTMT